MPVLAVLFVLGAAPLATPAEAPDQAELTDEADEAAEAAADLSPDVVGKLDKEQLANLLRQRERRLRDEDKNVIVPVALFTALVLIVVAALGMRLRQHHQTQQTLRLMVEKGAPIPAELLAPPRKQRSDLRRGVLLVCGGMGLAIFLALVSKDQPGAWSVALVPILVGAGYLLVWKLEPTP